MTTTAVNGNLRKGPFNHILIITRTNTQKILQHNDEKYKCSDMTTSEFLINEMMLIVFFFFFLKGKKDDKDQESILSSTTLDPGYHMAS